MLILTSFLNGISLYVYNMLYLINPPFLKMQAVLIFIILNNVLMNILGYVFFIHNCGNIFEYRIKSKIYGINHVLKLLSKKIILSYINRLCDSPCSQSSIYYFFKNLQQLHKVKFCSFGKYVIPFVYILTRHLSLLIVL